MLSPKVMTDAELSSALRVRRGIDPMGYNRKLMDEAADRITILSAGQNLPSEGCDCCCDECCTCG